MLQGIGRAEISTNRTRAAIRSSTACSPEIAARYASIVDAVQPYSRRRNLMWRLNGEHPTQWAESAANRMHRAYSDINANYATRILPECKWAARLVSSVFYSRSMPSEDTYARWCSRLLGMRAAI